MQGNDVREIWQRIIALEAKVAALEVEDEDYEILGSFTGSGSDGGTDGDARDVGCDLSTEERSIEDYSEDD